MQALSGMLDLVFIERRSKMLNKVKTKALISVGAVAATSSILMMGYTAGQHSTAKQSRIVLYERKARRNNTRIDAYSLKYNLGVMNSFQVAQQAIESNSIIEYGVAITFHRQLRSKNSFSSKLDGIAGLGPKRKQLLMKHFKSLPNIQKADVEDIINCGIPRNVAVVVKEKLAEEKADVNH